MIDSSVQNGSKSKISQLNIDNCIILVLIALKESSSCGVKFLQQTAQEKETQEIGMSLQNPF